MNVTRFIEKGYDLVEAENLSKLVELREQIVQKARELVGGEEEELESFLNNFHRRELRGPELNSLRMELIRFCSTQLKANRKVFDTFSDSITDLLGPDIVVQKTTNLVIQQPGDPDRVPIHRDAPLNSPFEIVVWLPLVDVFGTKSMWVLDRKNTATGLEMLKESAEGYSDINRFAGTEGEVLEVPFGHACFFWPGLVHGVDINAEHETRWALNVRYKHLFAPAGSKGQSEFFEVLKLSPLTRMGLELEKERYG